jgi:hypothetical protein
VRLSEIISLIRERTARAAGASLGANASDTGTVVNNVLHHVPSAGDLGAWAKSQAALAGLRSTLAPSIEADWRNPSPPSPGSAPEALAPAADRAAGIAALMIQDMASFGARGAESQARQPGSLAPVFDYFA